MSDTTPMMLTVKAAGEESGLSRSTLYRWLRDRVIRAKKLGKSTLIDRESLRQAIADLPDYR
jgi:excisionase family DNA binding protein